MRTIFARLKIALRGFTARFLVSARVTFLRITDSAQMVAGTHVANLTRRRTRAMRSIRRILTTRMTRAVLMVPLLLPVSVQIWRVRVCVRA